MVAMTENKLPKGVKNLIGFTTGKLTVTEFSHLARRSYWKCLCECGNTESNRKISSLPVKSRAVDVLRIKVLGIRNFIKYGKVSIIGLPILSQVTTITMVDGELR